MATIMRDVVPGWQLINIISISSIIFLRTNSLAFAFSEEEKLKKVSCPKALPFLVKSFYCLCLKIIVSQSFSSVLSALCCAFFQSRFAINFFFFGARVLFFSTTSTTTFDSSLKQKREKRKDFETFLSLFFPLFDTNTTTLTLLNEGREDEHALFFYSSSVL